MARTGDRFTLIVKQRTDLFAQSGLVRARGRCPAIAQLPAATLQGWQS